MAFHDVRLPEDIESGARGGLGFYTTIVPSPSGVESRNQNWEDDRGEWDISYGIDTVAAMEAAISFFYARRGSLHSFRFKDFTDYRVEGGFIGEGSAGDADVLFPLIKYYDDAVNPYLRRIFKPIPDTIQMYVEASPVAHTLGDDGIVTLGAPVVEHAEVTADFEFDIPVRFALDRLDLDVTHFDALAIPSLKLVGVRPPLY